MKKVRAISLYISQLLDRKEQTEIFARFLSQIKSSEEEKIYFWKYAHDAGLDRENITKRVYELSIQNSSSSFHQNGTNEIISALNWLCIEVNQRDKALIQANHLLVEFLLKDDFVTCNKLVEVLPEDSLLFVLQTKSNQIDVLLACREYFCLEIYLSCQNLYSSWEQKKNELQKTLSTSIAAVSSAISKDKLQREISSITQEFIDLAFMMLQFPPERIEAKYFTEKYSPVLDVIHQPGWLIDEYECEDSKRNMSLDLLRRHAIPKIIFQLENVFAFEERYLEIVKMADWITDLRWKIYVSLSKDEIREFLKRVRLATIQILKTTKDPLGMKLKI